MVEHLVELFSPSSATLYPQEASLIAERRQRQNEKENFLPPLFFLKLKNGGREKDPFCSRLTFSAPMSPSSTVVLLAIFYLVLLLFAASDLKRFTFHVHISRVDRVPIAVDNDFSSSLWYPVLFGIVSNIAILILSAVNFYTLLWQDDAFRRLLVSTMLLVILLTVRLITNVVVTRNRNGQATPTLVERSFFAPSLSLEEELMTLALDWLVKMVGLIGTRRFCYRHKQEQAVSAERQRRRETPLISDFE